MNSLVMIRLPGLFIFRFLQVKLISYLPAEMIPIHYEKNTAKARHLKKDK